MRSKFKWIFALLMAFSMQFSFAQEKTITGTVTEARLPLPGVSVVVKGTTRGTQTDMDGNYYHRSKNRRVFGVFIHWNERSALLWLVLQPKLMWLWLRRLRQWMKL